MAEGPEAAAASAHRRPSTRSTRTLPSQLGGQLCPQTTLAAGVLDIGLEPAKGMSVSALTAPLGRSDSVGVAAPLVPPQDVATACAESK